MGDRATIQVKDGDSTVCPYTHWAGTELPDTLRRALERGRWDDGPYLARIIFCEMVKYDPLGDTGYGISQFPSADIGDRLLTVDVGKQTVTAQGGPPISFKSYVEQLMTGWRVLR